MTELRIAARLNSMKIPMNNKVKLGFAAILVAGVLSFFLLKPQAIAAQDSKPVPAAAAENKESWNVRCSAEKGVAGRECEVYQRLVVAKSGQRIAEFAVGFPKDKPDGRGVIILPLGVLLNDNMEMQVDSGQKFKFKPRYCTTEGCFSFINLDQSVLDLLKKGTEIELTTKAMSGKDIKIKMTLKGLSKALKLAAES